MQESSTELPHLAWIGFLFLLSFGVLDISEREREREGIGLLPSSTG